VALEEDLTGGNILNPYCLLTRLQVDNLIYQEERPAVWDYLLDFSGT
jgi:hypothetical protein